MFDSCSFGNTKDSCYTLRCFRNDLYSLQRGYHIFILIELLQKSGSLSHIFAPKNLKIIPRENVVKTCLMHYTCYNANDLKVSGESFVDYN